MKRALAGLITLALLGVVLYLQRTPPAPAPEASRPEDCLRAMFAAAEAGDVQAYQACFTGPARETLQRQLAGQPTEQFAASLQAATAALKGHAVLSPSDAERDAGQLSLTVERIYQDRMDRQVYHLVRQPDGWRIDDVGSATPVQPPVRYGTHVGER